MCKYSPCQLKISRISRLNAYQQMLSKSVWYWQILCLQGPGCFAGHPSFQDQDAQVQASTAVQTLPDLHVQDFHCACMSASSSAKLLQLCIGLQDTRLLVVIHQMLKRTG